MARPSASNNIKPAAMDTGYLSQQVSTIIGQLHGLFDEIGVPGHERESREEEVCAYTSTDLPNLLPPKFSDPSCPHGDVVQR